MEVKQKSQNDEVPLEGHHFSGGWCSVRGKGQYTNSWFIFVFINIHHVVINFIDIHLCEYISIYYIHDMYIFIYIYISVLIIVYINANRRDEFG